MNKRSSYLEQLHGETLGAVRQERDSLRIKVAALENELKTHKLRKQAEDLLVAASASDRMPEELCVYTLTDFMQKRAQLMKSGKEGLQKSAAAIELITTGKAPGFELGGDDLDVDQDLKNDPLAHLYM